MRIVARFWITPSSVRQGASLWALPLLLCLLLFAQGCGKGRLSTTVPTGGAAKGSAVVATARSQIGKPYKFGGDSPQTGFDCSGLILWSYRQQGITVPRQAKDQAKAGRAVDQSHLREGDIVVFRISSGVSGIHTGIYSGRGRFIHSPSTGKRIREDSLETDYWKRRYITARRVL